MGRKQEESNSFHRSMMAAFVVGRKSIFSTVRLIAKRRAQQELPCRRYV
jgi:hypothetical protein